MGRHRKLSWFSRLRAWLHRERHGQAAGVTYRTKTGLVLTDADIAALADEAERGYDLSRLRPRDAGRG